MTVRDPVTASDRLTRWNSWTDGESPDGKRTRCLDGRSGVDSGRPSSARVSLAPRVRDRTRGHPCRTHAGRSRTRRAGGDAARPARSRPPPACPLGPNPRVGCVLLDADGRRGRRGVPPRRRAPARRGRGAPRRSAVPRPGSPPSSPSSRATTPAAPVPAPRRCWRPGSPGSSSPSPTPTRSRPGGGVPSAARGVDVAGGAARRRGARGQPGLDLRRRARPPLRHLEVRHLASTGAAPPPTAPAAGSATRPHGATPTGCAASATSCWPAPARSSSTTRSSPCATRPTCRCRASSSRCARSWGCATCRRTAASSTTHAETVHLRTRDPHAALSASSTPAAAGTSSSRAAPGSPRRSWRPGWSTRSSPTSRRCSSAAGTHAVEGLDRHHDRRRRAGSTSPTSRSLGHRPRPQRAAHHEPDPDRPDESPHHRGGRLRCSPESSRSSAPSRRWRTRATPCASPCAARSWSRTPRSATRSRSTACCLTVAERERRHVHRRRHARDARQDQPRRARPRQPRSTSSARSPPTKRLGGHIVQGHVDATGTVVGRTPSEHWEVVDDRASRRALAPYLVDKGSVTVDGVSLTVVASTTRAGTFTVSLIPETLARTTLGPERARRRRQPRGRRDRQVRRAHARPQDRTATDPAPGRRTRHAAGRTRSASTPSRTRSPTSPPARRSSSSTTRTARTRATSSSRPARSTPELMAFTIRHSSGVICVPMPAHDARPARDPADDAAQQGPDAHGVHDLRRRPRRRHAPASAPPTGRTPSGRWPTPRPSRGRSPGPGHVFPLRYREGGVLARRGHTEAAVDLARMAGLTPVGVLVEVVNDDGTMKRGQRAARLRRRARAEADLDRADGAPPPPHREPRRAGRRDPAADPVRRLHRVRLPDRDRRLRARRARVRRPRRRSPTASRSSPGCTPSA